MYALAVMRDFVETAQAGGSDLVTTQLISCGFIDMLISALSAVEKVGVDTSAMSWDSLSVGRVIHNAARP